MIRILDVKQCSQKEVASHVSMLDPACLILYRPVHTVVAGLKGRCINGIEDGWIAMDEKGIRTRPVSLE